MLRSLNLLRKMSSSSIPDVSIDPEGVFKYILIKLTVQKSDGNSETKEIVRGYAECPYHSDINDKVTDQLQKLKVDGSIKEWKSKVLGGGRIDHNAAGKSIKVYGYSQGYGKADHEVAVGLIKKVYPNYDVTWSDEGY
ncbi:14 kDa phosphohistidine phosphatase-like [Onthophagus taurus]|uniref:14 kDa phosphohistidine phosphatase-like n=1 Tax=Onthophagus taurus TaxID=166361 RepID=UPI000C203D80|nr:14 kDa phosphohistidine phosphatase-like [Onthophagus taurus]